MPTTVDSLVVTLGLDPSAFNEGQKKALESLRRFEEQAKNSVRKSQQNSEFNVRFFFAALQHPLQAAQQALMDFATKSSASTNRISDAAKQSQKGMKDVADQSKRTGDAVEEGAATGAAAVRGLAAAGLLALGAFKGIQNVLGQIQKEVNFSTMTNFMAQWTGTSPEWISRFSAAAYKKTGAPQEQTQNWLLGLQSAIQAFVTPGSMQQGVATPMIQSLMRMGINPFPLVGQNPQDAMDKLLPQIEEKMASAKPEQRAMFAQQLGMPLLLMQFMSMGSAAVKAATEAEKVVQVTGKEAKAAQDLAEAERQVLLDTDKLSRIMMTQLAPALTAVLKAISGFLEFIPQFGAWIDKMMNNLPEWAQKSIEYAGPIGWMIAALRGMKPNPDNPMPSMNFGSGNHWGGGKPGPGGDMPLDLRSAPSGIATQSFSGPTEQEWNTLSRIASRESGGGTQTGYNLWNYKHDEDPNYWTAGGYWQIIRGNWRKYAPQVGIDLNQYPEAINAPPELQARVALLMLRQQGTQPWSKAAGGSMPNIAANNNTPPPVATQTQSLINNRASSSTVNSGGNTMHNNINITLPPGSSNYQVGQAAASEVQRQIAVSSANYGYE